MDIVARAKGLILSPREEWPRVAAEPADTQSLFTGYAMPLAAIPAVAGFIALAILGASLSVATGGAARVGIAAALGNAILSYLLGLVGVFVVGKIIEALSPRFGGTPDPVAAMKLAVYAPTAAWVAGIAILIPLLGGLIAIIGAIYSLYLFWVGAPIVARVPQDRLLVFTLAVIACAIVINIVIGLLAAAVL
jgi:hypothetical protein